MEIQFKKLQTPNFIRCEQGTFAIGELSKKEILRYVDLLKFSIIHKWEESQSD